MAFLDSGPCAGENIQFKFQFSFYIEALII